MNRLRFLCVFIYITSINSTQIFNKCGSVISGHQFIIQSKHGNPNPCHYWFKSMAQCNSEFHLQFLEFDKNCSETRVEIFNSTICGFKNEIIKFKSKNGLLNLKIITNEKYKILVTRLPCPEKVIATTDFGTLPYCCAEAYSSRRFYLSSPGFPDYSTATDCVYKIYRANPNICRLRIHFKYFWLGVPQNGACYYGFLELDGKVICGCHSGVNIISQFDQIWGDSPKIIRLRNSNQNSKGFVLEIIQDECPTKYTPTLDSNLTVFGKTEKVPEFYYYNDQLNKVIFPNQTQNTTKANIANTPNTKIDYYFFKAPDDTSEAQKEKEPDFFDTTSPNFTLPDDNNIYKCQNWNNNNWTALTQEVLWQKMKQCQKFEQTSPKCCEINYLRGYLISPGYPYYYPGNLNICYRFQKLNNYCGVKLSIFDFDLEMSQNCIKDSVILYDHYKYCGGSLKNNYLTFDLTSKQFEDVKFITDKYYCGRGFKIYFEHTPCEVPPPYVPPMTTTVSPVSTCGGEINSEFFEFNFSQFNEQCLYYLQKSHEDVCGIQLLFLNFDLVCGMAYLSINNKQYCGQLNAKKAFITFDQSQEMITVEYRRHREHRPVMSSIIVVRGQQVRGDCDPFIYVPAQRLLKMDPGNDTNI